MTSLAKSGEKDDVNPRHPRQRSAANTGHQNSACGLQCISADGSLQGQLVLILRLAFSSWVALQPCSVLRNFYLIFEWLYGYLLFHKA